MKPVYQTVCDKHKGNCMQATVASIFNLTLDEVPNFIELGDEWYYTMTEFYSNNGYNLTCFNPKEDIDLTKQVLNIDGGVNGYWCASVNSVFFGEGFTHSVIIDKNMNIVHDPNPNNKNNIYTSKDILSIDVCSKQRWYIDLDGTIKID